MVITISYSNIIGVVERSLSIIGKRSADDNGQPLFKDITLGSRETSILKDYINEAILHVIAQSSAFVSASSIQGTDNDTVTLTLPDNHNSALQTFIQKSFNTYCTAYALYSWFTISMPSLAKKYQESSSLQLTALIKLIYNKKEPVTSGSYADVDGTINDDNDNINEQTEQRPEDPDNDWSADDTDNE